MNLKSIELFASLRQVKRKGMLWEIENDYYN